MQSQAATQIQCAWWACKSRRRLAALKNKLEYGRRVLRLQEAAAATTIQKAARSYFARRHLDLLREERTKVSLAATRIQKVYRSFRARALLHQHSAATLIQWHFLKWMMSRQKELQAREGL